MGTPAPPPWRILGGEWGICDAINFANMFSPGAVGFEVEPRHLRKASTFRGVGTDFQLKLQPKRITRDENMPELKDVMDMQHMPHHQPRRPPATDLGPAHPPLPQAKC